MTRRYNLHIIALAALCSLALAACSSGKAVEVVEPITAGDLPEMMIPEDTIDIGGFAVNVDPNSLHPSSPEDRILDSFNPDDDAADAETYGFQSDFGKWYFPADPASGLAYVSTGAYFYDTPEGASGDVVNDFEDLQAFIGNTNQRGAQLLTVQAIVIDLDGARGMRISTLLNNETLYITIVKVARGPVVAGLGIAAKDNRDLTADATRLAEQLANQVSTVLNHGVTPSPTPTAAPPATPTPSATP